MRSLHYYLHDHMWSTRTRSNLQPQFLGIGKKRIIAELQNRYNVTRGNATATEAAFQLGWPEALVSLLMGSLIVSYISQDEEDSIVEPLKD